MTLSAPYVRIVGVVCAAVALVLELMTKDSNPGEVVPGLLPRSSKSRLKTGCAWAPQARARKSIMPRRVW